MASESIAAKPNIIYILADDLGYGDLGCYGQKQIKTPNIDKMATEGMRFTRHYSGSTVCAPSRCTLMTGLHTGHCYIRDNGKYSLRPSDVTVAQTLQKAGYTNGIVGKWGLGQEGSTGTPNKKGFDYFYGYLDQQHAHNYYPEYLFENESRVKLNNFVPDAGQYGEGVASEKKEYSHDLMVEKAMDFINENKQKPFFLYLALTIPHANNEGDDLGMEVPSTEPYTNENWPQQQKNMAAMVTRMDRDIARIDDLLKKLNIYDNTVVFFTSDNGPHKEGGNDPEFFNSSGSLRGIKRSLYEGGIRVPMIARWPSRIPAKSSSDHSCAFWDVFPTLAEIAETDVPEGLDGISFLPELLGKSQQQRKHESLYWEFHGGKSCQAVMSGNFKAVRQSWIKQPDGPLELYDIEKDPQELTDIAKNHPELVAKFDKLFGQARTESELFSTDIKARKKKMKSEKDVKI